MESIKRIVTVFVLALILMGIGAATILFVLPNTSGTKIDGSYINYDKEVFAAIEAGETVLWISDLDDMSIDKLLDKIIDNPDLFWIDTNVTIVSLGNMNCIQLATRYDNIESTKYQIEQAADTIIKRIITEDMTEYDKVIAIHDWMCENIYYCEDSNNSDQDVYGALVNKRAVCAGYAKAFAYLCNKVGVECEVLSGVARNSKMEEVSHAWNRVKIDGKYSYWDVTWDDAETGYWTRNWCGASSEDISYSHTLAQTYKLLPADNTYNYYYRNDMYINKYSASAIGAQIKQQGRVLNLKCANIETYEKVIQALGNSEELQKIMRSGDINHIGTIKYIADENAKCIRITVH